ncbi:hypothetical protein Tco_0178899 [Tanacetum coccineum]
MLKRCGKLSNLGFVGGKNDESKEDAERAFHAEDAIISSLGLLPSAWVSSSLIMRTKQGVDKNTSSTNDVAMISMRMKKFYKTTGRKLQFDAKEPVGFDKTKNIGNKDKDNKRRSGKHEDSKGLVTLDGEGVDWTSHSEDEQENYALIACSSSGSDT